MANLKQANITVDPTIWGDFKIVTKENDSDASKEIRKFMKRYLSENPPKIPKEKK